MLLKWGLITLTVAGVVGLVLGGALPDGCGTTTADRDAPGDLRDEAALAERLAALDAALASQNLSRAGLRSGATRMAWPSGREDGNRWRPSATPRCGSTP